MWSGLFLMGLGVGNLGPLTMSGAMTAAGDQTTRASARLGHVPQHSQPGHAPACRYPGRSIPAFSRHMPSMLVVVMLAIISRV